MSFELPIVDGFKIQSTNPVVRSSTCVTGLSGVALLVIGALSAAGVVSSSVMGGCAIGLSVPAIISNIGQACDKEIHPTVRKSSIASIILNLVLPIMGALAIGGVISGAAVGWTIIGLTIGSCCLTSCITSLLGAGATGYVLGQSNSGSL